MEPFHLDLQKQTESNGSQIVMRLSGKLSLETVHNFIQTLRPEPAPHLILDLGGVSFLDSAGVGAGAALCSPQKPGTNFRADRTDETEQRGDPGRGACQAPAHPCFGGGSTGTARLDQRFPRAG